MSLEKKIKNMPSRIIGSSLAGYLFGSLFSLLVSCNGGGGSSPVPPPTPPQPQNRDPAISSTLKTSANEGDNYFDRVIASDPDNDALTYFLNQKPNGMTINSNDGTITWADAQEGSFPISMSVSDNKGGTATQNGVLTVNNAFDNLSGRVNDILNGNNVNGADVVFGHRDINGNFVADFTNRTDLSGNYSFNRIPTGARRLVKIGNNPNYLEHLAGGITTNGDLSDVNFELIPGTFNINFFDEVARATSVTQRWLTQPSIYINTSPALGSGIQPTQQEIDLAESIFKNDIPRFNNGFTNGNIQITKGTNPPPYGTQGVIRFEWRDDLGAGILGSHGEWLNGNEIISASADVRTRLTGSQQLYVNRQEATQVFGARNDSNLEQSIFNDPQTPGVDNYTQADLNLGKILYKRPIGNRSVNGIPDSNPDGYDIR